MGQNKMSTSRQKYIAAYLLDELELIWDLLLRLPLPLPLRCVLDPP